MEISTTKNVFENGDTVSWEVEVSNNGFDTCVGVNVCFEVEEGLSLLYSGTITSSLGITPLYDKGLFDASNIIWWVGDLEGGEKQTITVDIKVEDISLIYPRLFVRADVKSKCDDDESDNCFYLYLEKGFKPNNSCKTGSIKLK